MHPLWVHVYLLVCSYSGNKILTPVNYLQVVLDNELFIVIVIVIKHKLYLAVHSYRGI